MTLFKNKKIYSITKENRNKILYNIDRFANLPNGIFAKSKQYEHGYYIKIIVDKTKIEIDHNNDKYLSLPDTINFLIICDWTFPDYPPKIICQTNVS